MCCITVYLGQQKEKAGITTGEQRYQKQISTQQMNLQHCSHNGTMSLTILISTHAAFKSFQFCFSFNCGLMIILQ